jgi:hypothetical protein
MRHAGSVAAEALFVGSDDVSVRCRSIDWSATSLGGIDGWPESLRTMVRTCLGAPSIPMAIWMGPERVLIYNQGCVPLVGSRRHPWALGRPAPEIWPELWERLGPMLHRVIDNGEPIRSDDGWFEPAGAAEPFFACSLTPIRGDREEIVGALSVLQETP